MGATRKNMNIKLAVLLTISFLFAGCSEPEEECTTGSTSAECRVETDLGIDAGLLKIDFLNSDFYDINTNSWVVLKAVELNSGLISSTVPVYSSYLNLGINEAVNSAKNAKGQKDDNLAEKNQVPFIEFAAKDGVRYLYRYQKKTLSGTLLVDEQGIVPVTGTRAILPLVNASFNGQYFTSESTVGTKFKNVVQIIAETNKKAGSAYQIEFESIFAIQSIDFLTAFSAQIQNYSLPTRWKSYNNATNTSGNTNFSFVTLQDKKAIPTSVPVDTRVVFKAKPKLQMRQELFFELPFQGDLFKVSQVVVPDRGHKFYTTTINLDSDRDFNFKVFLGGELLTPNSLNFEKSNFPSGKKFDVSFSYDFSQNVKYGPDNGDPFSRKLLYPLKPVCSELKDISYFPWTIEPLRDLRRSEGKYFAVCDLDDTAKVELETSSQTRMDTWYDYFSYAPYRPDKNELGHFFGIKSVTFYMDMCLKIQVKAVGEAEWVTKTEGGSNCGDSNSDESWSQVYVERTFTVFDYVNLYKNVKDLNSIIERFKSSSTETYPTMKFNNEILNGDQIRHIY